jgi:hypothetical protein
VGKGEYGGYASWEACLGGVCYKNQRLGLIHECQPALRFMGPCDLRAAAHHVPKLKGDPVLPPKGPSCSKRP